MEGSTNQDKIKGRSIAKWCIDNSNKTIGIGVLSIIIGAAISVYIKEAAGLSEWDMLKWEMLGHFCIILGEIVAVAFFLHNVIDAEIQKDRVEEVEAAIAVSYRKTIEKVDEKVTEWNRDMAVKTKEIQLDLVKAILHGMGILPFQIVDLLRAEDYKPHLIRREMKLYYEFKGFENGVLHCYQTMGFVLSNAGGEGAKSEEYDMQLALTSTPQAKYTYLSAEYKHFSKHSKKPNEVKLHPEAYSEVDGVRRLKDPIVLNGADSVDVFQAFNVCYETKDNSVISDIFSASNYNWCGNMYKRPPQEFFILHLPHHFQKENRLETRERDANRQNGFPASGTGFLH